MSNGLDSEDSIKRLFREEQMILIENAAERISSKMEVNMLQMESRLAKMLPKEIERVLGMTPSKHSADHARFTRLADDLDDIKKHVTRLVLGALVACAMTGAFYAGGSSRQEIPHAIIPNSQHQTEKSR